MNKKEQRKGLELELLKTIEAVLNKQNSDATKKIRKTSSEAAKAIAKKFYKSQKVKSKLVKKPKVVSKAKPKTKAKPAIAVKKAKGKK